MKRRPLVVWFERGKSRPTMASEGLSGLIGASNDLPLAPFLTARIGSSALHALESWMLARVIDGGREATFTIETDERFVRVRRVHGSTASMIECKLPSPMTAADVAQTLVRWAPSQSMSARVQPDTTGVVRLVVALRTD